jgi:hypothetical protein
MNIRLMIENWRTQGRLNALKWKILDDDRRERGLPPLPRPYPYAVPMWACIAIIIVCLLVKWGLGH